MAINFSELLTVTFTLFAVIDVIGSVPILISIKEKTGGFSELKGHIDLGSTNDLVLVPGKRVFKVARR